MKIAIIFLSIFFLFTLNSCECNKIQHLADRPVFPPSPFGFTWRPRNLQERKTKESKTEATNQENSTEQSKDDSEKSINNDADRSKFIFKPKVFGKITSKSSRIRNRNKNGASSNNPALIPDTEERKEVTTELSSNERVPSERTVVDKVSNEKSTEQHVQPAVGIPRAIGSFGIRIFKSLYASNPRENQIYSPIGIANAFSILMYGASKNSLLEVFHGLRLNESFTNPEEAHNAFKNFYVNLNAINQNKYFTLDIANLILIQRNFPEVRKYVESLKKYYDFGFGEVDFVNDADKVLNDVNNWIANSTHNKIENFLKEPLDSLTKLVILNAVYLNGTWVEAFDQSLTGPGAFYNYGTEAKTVQFMNNQADYGYYENKEKKFSLLEMKYKGDVSFVILLPTEKDGLSSIASKITGRDLFPQFAYKQIQLSIPKFKLSSKYDLKKVLPKIGIKAIFTPGADLSGISGSGSGDKLFVSSAIHQSMIEIDEQGTVATSVTSVNIGSRSTRTPIFNVNHPFLFYIRNVKSKLIYFMGKVSSL